MKPFICGMIIGTAIICFITIISYKSPIAAVNVPRNKIGNLELHMMQDGDKYYATVDSFFVDDKSQLYVLLGREAYATPPNDKRYAEVHKVKNEYWVIVYGEAVFDYRKLSPNVAWYQPVTKLVFRPLESTNEPS